MTNISASRRHKSATVRTGKKEKYPVDSVQTATSALHLLNNASPPLSDSQRQNVIKKAHRFAPNVEAPPPKGSKPPSPSKEKKKK